MGAIGYTQAQVGQLYDYLFGLQGSNRNLIIRLNPGAMILSTYTVCN